jgi:hypothetical protein
MSTRASKAAHRSLKARQGTFAGVSYFVADGATEDAAGAAATAETGAISLLPVRMRGPPASLSAIDLRPARAMQSSPSCSSSQMPCQVRLFFTHKYHTCFIVKMKTR